MDEVRRRGSERRVFLVYLYVCVRLLSDCYIPISPPDRASTQTHTRTHHPLRRRVVAAQGQPKRTQTTVGAVDDLASVAHTRPRPFVVKCALCVVCKMWCGGVWMMVGLWDGKRKGRDCGSILSFSINHRPITTHPPPHSTQTKTRTHPFLQGVTQRAPLRPHLIEANVPLPLHPHRRPDCLAACSRGGVPFGADDECGLGGFLLLLFLLLLLVTCGGV